MLMRYKFDDEISLSKHDDKNLLGAPVSTTLEAEFLIFYTSLSIKLNLTCLNSGILLAGLMTSMNLYPY